MKINEIYCGNCIEIMQKMSNNFIDLTVTSPPYDNLRKYKGYLFDFKSVAKELYRITKEGGVVVWVVGDATIKGNETGTSFRQALYFKEIGFNLHDTMIYQKNNPFNFGSNNCYIQSFEYMFVFSKGKIKTVNFIKDRINKNSGKSFFQTRRSKNDFMEYDNKKVVLKKIGRRFNIWSINTQGYKNHPAVFPEQLANDHIISWSNKNDLVLDPMCGSGTTCKMAKHNSRNYIGIDCCQEYCDIAKSRII